MQTLKTLFKTGFFHIFGSSAINKIIAFLSSIVLVRILSKTEYGIFTYAWNIYSIIMLFNGMGIESGVLQISSEHSGDSEYAKHVCNYGSRFGLKFDVLLVCLILGIGLFAPLKIGGAGTVLCSLCLLPIVQLVYDMIAVFLRSQKRNQEYAKLQVLNTLLIFGASVLGAYLFRTIGMVFGRYFAYIVTFLVATLCYGVRIINRDSSNIGNDAKPLLKIAIISMLNNGLSQLMYLLDVFVLGIVDPQETVLASYKVATMIPTALVFIPSALVTYLYPYFAEHKDDHTWCMKNYKRILIGLGILNLGISSVLFFGASLIIRLLFGIQYLDAVPVFRILALNYFLSGTFRTLSGNLLVTQRKLKFNLVIAIVASTINIIGDYFFIRWWGSIGAAIATVSVVLVSSIMSTSYLIYTFKKPITVSS